MRRRIVLPRSEVIVRAINLQGVLDRDLHAAVGYQMEGLHLTATRTLPQDMVAWRDAVGAGGDHQARDAAVSTRPVFAEAGVAIG